MNKNFELFKLFTIASTLTFSGGLAMVPLLDDKLVKQYHYLSSDDFYHYIAISQSIPGVTAVTTACLLGEKINGRSGRYSAALGAILPVLVIMMLLTVLYQMIPQTGIIQYLFIAIRATAGIYILEAGVSMIPHIITRNAQSYFMIIFVFILVTFLNVSIPWIILGCFLLSLFVLAWRNFK
ncbi:chromate transporter [Erysipelothrix sp. HDW6B]|uniref:chromate transporter n=1 Tax=Erysipelothrix TaxID=1647 RepID=UPI00135B0C64|nr:MULTISPECIES: chromate transporter [Erysipelothrix]QIK86280.1 chromate transporter [Erysipelothrix sp. HDW6B]